MTWTDEFDDAFDPARFSAFTAGGGSVAVAGGVLSIAEAVDNDAAGVALVDEITGDMAVKTRAQMNGSMNNTGLLPLLGVSDGLMSAVSSATWAANTRINVYVNYVNPNYLLYIRYLDAAGVNQYWTGSAWSNVATAVMTTGANNRKFTCSVIFRNGKFRVAVWRGDNVRAIAETSYVQLSGLKAYTGLYAYAGDPRNNATYATSAEWDYFAWLDDAATWTVYNGRNAAGVYSCGRAVSFDSKQTWYRDPELALISAAAGENLAKNPVISVKDETQYLHYAVRLTSGKWRTRLKTSADWFETSVDHGYVLSEGGAGEVDENYALISWAAYDEGAGIWRAYGPVQNGASITQIGYFTSADPTGGWTKYINNPVVTPPAWAPNIISPAAAVIVSGGLPAIFASGYDAAALRWRFGKYLSTSWTDFAEADGNPISEPPTTSRTTLAAQAAAGATALEVASSAIFAEGMPIAVGDADLADVELARVLSMPDGTHVNLYYPLDNLHTNGSNVAPLSYGDPGVQQVFDAYAMITQIHFTSTDMDVEICCYYDRAGDVFTLNSSRSPVMPLGPVGAWDQLSSENTREPILELALPGGFAVLNRLRRQRRAA